MNLKKMCGVQKEKNRRYLHPTDRWIYSWTPGQKKNATHTSHMYIDHVMCHRNLRRKLLFVYQFNFLLNETHILVLAERPKSDGHNLSLLTKDLCSCSTSEQEPNVTGRLERSRSVSCMSTAEVDGW